MLQRNEHLPSHRLPPPHVLREIAVAALTDPRTVGRVLEGRPTRAATRSRVLLALHARTNRFPDIPQDEGQP